MFLIAALTAYREKRQANQQARAAERAALPSAADCPDAMPWAEAGAGGCEWWDTSPGISIESSD